MPMNLVLDFGNTRIKAGIFEGAELIEKHFFKSPSELIQAGFTEKTFGNSRIQNCLIASVTRQHQEVFEHFNKKFRTLIFTNDTPLPITNKYKTVTTLGSDRLAVAVGAQHLYDQQNVLSIDAGTCIKYNFVNANNEYLGGAISPGILMRFKALHEYTAALPLVESDFIYTKYLGENTVESILSGAQVAAACEIDGMISYYSNDYKDLIVVVTGGDSEYLCSQLKSRFFANQNLLLQGLNSILNYNLEK